MARTPRPGLPVLAAVAVAAGLAHAFALASPWSGAPAWWLQLVALAVLVATVGTEVQFPNLDAVRHHVYSFSPTKKFEIKLYKGKEAQPVLFDQPGVVLLGCNIHDNMVGWIVVVDTPYHAQTGVDGAVPGRVRLDNVPAGSYQLRVWHPRQPIGEPAVQQTLQVPATGEVAATVRMAGLQP